MTLYLMCGLAFAGKSTLAAAISRRIRADVISLDELNAARGLYGGSGISVEEWARTHRDALVLVENALRTGRDAIVDDTNCLRFLRDNYRAVARSCGAETIVIYVDAPASGAIDRLRSNERTGARAAVTRAVMHDLIEKFEVPQADEPTLVVPAGADPELWIAEHLPR